MLSLDLYKQYEKSDLLLVVVNFFKMQGGKKSAIQRNKPGDLNPQRKCGKLKYFCKKFSSYFTINTPLVHYKDKPVNVG
jgi:hypothetical protein